MMFLMQLWSVTIIIFALGCNSFALLNPPYISSCLQAHGSVGRLTFCYQRLQAVPPKDMENLPVDQVAEALEDVLKAFKDEASEESYIACLDGWMVAFNKSQRNIVYGERMVQVLDMMEKNSLMVTTVDPYASVIHAWLSCQDSKRALEILVRMESNPRLKAKDNAKLIQYNKILQGLVNASEVETAVKLLDCMCQGSSMVWKGLSFTASVKPNAKSFALLFSALSIEQDEQIYLTLLREARKLNVLEGFLLQNISRKADGGEIIFLKNLLDKL
mmetsp:Transcript_29661/g.28510  ORF Transcript_29661/g.28510 Transcript_29661/m.28510 type:complete len:274 (-) Transcript_29661:264-1085(-)